MQTFRWLRTFNFFYKNINAGALTTEQIKLHQFAVHECLLILCSRVYRLPLFSQNVQMLRNKMMIYMYGKYPCILGQHNILIFKNVILASSELKFYLQPVHLKS